MKVLVIGAGPAGCAAARALAEKGARVEIWEKRPWIGGNAYDRYNDAGILVHVYGPHILHTKDRGVWDFLSRFTAWYPLEHHVLASVHGKMIPVPFNLLSLRATHPAAEADRLEKKLKETYGDGARVGISALRESRDPEIRKLADYVFENVFAYYTRKQWGTDPDQVDPATLARVPVLVSEDCRYFQDPFQGMPLDGYTRLFESMLDHPAIHTVTGTDALRRLSVEDGQAFVDGRPAEDLIILYTGALDALFGFRFGRLPYRTLDFETETLPVDSYQDAPVVNYTVDQPFTRITEFKKLTGQRADGVTTIMREYSRACGEKDEPCYPIADQANLALHDRYRSCLPKNVIPLGRLAEYRYYNMDAIVKNALETVRDM